jgi:hypothetical protein
MISMLSWKGVKFVLILPKSVSHTALNKRRGRFTQINWTNLLDAATVGAFPGFDWVFSARVRD